MENNKGITLIVLVVTIVVLMILASISIVALTGDSSVVKQATEAQIMTELSNVKEALEIYKIRNHSDGDMSDEELVEEGLLKEVFVNDTYRTVAILTDLKTIEVSGKLGKSGKKQDKTEVATLLDLYDVYGIDMEDGTLYYIRNGIWSIEGNKTTYTADTGEEKEGYVVETINQTYLENMKFITEWTVEAGTTITLPITKAYEAQIIDITIEWGADDDGDGKLDIEECTTVQPTHTYTEAGTYTIKILGDMPNWDFGTNGDTNAEKEYITGLKQWGKVGIEQISFSECTNLAGTIPNHKVKGEFTSLQSANSLFYKCVNLSGTIPSDLFEGCENIKGFSFSRAFANCPNLTGTIPEGLFKDAINAESFNDTFSGCSGLTGQIPSKLFANNTKANKFQATFNGCTNLTGAIPAELFCNNTEITSIRWVFRNCEGITKIPKGLFKNCSKITNFGLAFSNTSITEIPLDIFDINNGQPNGITDLAGVFENTLITQIPDGLFDLCTEATNFGNPWAYSGIFQDCKLIETIPDKLFYNNTKATSFANAFSGCTNLKEIPENIFNTQEEVSLYATFYACKGLTKISGKVFENMPNIINWGATFDGCSNLIEIGEGFKIIDSVQNIDKIFFNCQKLERIPDGIVIPESLTSIKGIFAYCGNLTATVTLNANPEIYNLAFYGVNSEFRLNWSEPCTEAKVDEILTENKNIQIKGIEVTE